MRVPGDGTDHSQARVDASAGYEKPLRMLFIARHFTYFRNYDSALRALAARGHTIHLAVERAEAQGGQQAVETLARECARITYGTVPDRSDDAWTDLAQRLRHGLDYLRYLDPFYDDAPLRRVRARERTAQALISLADPPVLSGRAWRSGVGAFLHTLDKAVPPPQVLVDYLTEQAPDVLLITPLVDLGSQQIDYVRAARRLGIPTGLAVWSWDHLSSKAYIRECPERVLVWNGTQKHEATHVHGVPDERVVVTGAQCFDHWFERTPSRSREDFCRPLGLPPDRAMVLYVCTGLIMGSPPEPPFVRDWLTRLRASADPRVATAGVLIRPHPAQTAKWDGVDMSDLGPVAIWGGNPIDDQSRADYFDSLYHSAAVVGLNTSAFIEAGIVGREVLTILPPQFHDNQAGTVHFRYLLEIGGGLLRVSRDFDTHLVQLSQALARPATAEHPHKAFLESFVRPHGLGVPATPAFVAAVEALGHCRIDPRDVPATSVSRWRQAVLARLTAAISDPRWEEWVRSPREITKGERVRAGAQLKADRAADRVSARVRAREQHREQRQARIAALRADQKAAVVAERLARRQQENAQRDALRERLAAEKAEHQRQLLQKRARVDAERGRRARTPQER